MLDDLFHHKFLTDKKNPAACCESKTMKQISYNVKCISQKGKMLVNQILYVMEHHRAFLN